MTLSIEAATRKDKSTGKHVELQHRHFSFIAATLASCKPDGTNSADLASWEMIVSHFASDCAKSNPRFSRARFITACNQ